MSKSSYIWGVLQGIIIGICFACLDEPNFEYPLVIGLLTIVRIVIELKITK